MIALIASCCLLAVSAGRLSRAGALGGHDARDFNGDGRPDLLLRFEASDPGDPRHWEHVVWFMDGAVQTGAESIWPTPDGDPADRQLLAGAADFDGDGRSDLLFIRENTRLVEFWLMDGTHRVGEPIPLDGTPLAPEWRIAATGDFDHDGAADILWQSTATGALRLWLLQRLSPAKEVVPEPDRAVHANWSVVAVGDFGNGQLEGQDPPPALDGNLDLVWQNTTSGAVVIWFMDSGMHRITGRFAEPYDDRGFGNLVAVGDFVPGVRDEVTSFRETPPDLVGWFPPADPGLILDESGKLTIGDMAAGGNAIASVATCPPAPGTGTCDRRVTPAEPGWVIVGPR